MTTASPRLPDIDDARLDAIERDVFARIAEERRRARTRRRSAWAAGGAAAAVLVTAIVIAPFLTARAPGGTVVTMEDAVIPHSTDALLPALPHSSGESMPVAPDMVEGVAGDGRSAADSAFATPSGRDIVANGSASLVVDDVGAAARAVADEAVSRGGYVESMNISGSGTGSSSRAVGDAVMLPYPGSGSWVGVRVPADELSDMIDALARIGEVTASSISQDDVTDHAVDLRARIAASEASVARLTELVAQAESVGDLIDAETALAERQAILDSDRRQLELLEGRIAMSSLSVQLSPRHEPVTADPAGFGDGLVAGWNGLIATMNGIVVALGFLLPWLAVAAAAVALVWGVVRIVRKVRRGRRGDAEA